MSLQEMRDKYVVVDAKIDDMLDLLQSPAMGREPLANVQEEIKMIASEIERLRLIAKPNVDPVDQFRINFMAATGIASSTDKDKINSLARDAGTTPKVISEILTGAQADVPIRLVARLAKAIGTQTHILMKGVT